MNRASCALRERVTPHTQGVSECLQTGGYDSREAGEITPVIDRVCPLSDAPEAIRYLETGHARGKIVITVPGASR